MTPLERLDMMLLQSLARQVFSATEINALIDELPQTMEVLSLRLATSGRTTLNRTETRDLLLDLRPVARTVSLIEKGAA